MNGEAPRRPMDAGELAKKLEKTNSLGSGGEKTTYAHPDDKGKVVQVWNKEGMMTGLDRFDDPQYTPHKEMTPDEVKKWKRQYCLIKILRYLYPKQIPDIHAVNTEPRMMVRERVKRHADWYDIEHSEPTKAARVEFMAELDALDVPYDPNNLGNFLSAEDGEQKYVDTFFYDPRKRGEYDPSQGKYDIWPLWPTQEEEQTMISKIETAVQERLTGRDQENALHYIERFKKLLT